MRLNDVSEYEFRMPISMIGIGDCPACWSCLTSTLQLAIGVVVGRLGIADVLPEEAGLDGVGAPDLGDVSLKLGMYLLAYRPARAADFEAALG